MNILNFDREERANVYVMAGLALAFAGIALGSFAWLKRSDQLADADRWVIDVLRNLDQARTSASAKRSIVSRRREDSSEPSSRLILERATANKFVIDARLDRARGSEKRDRATFRVKGDYSQLKDLLSGLHAPGSGLHLSSLRLSGSDATPVSQLSGEIALELRE